MQSEAAELAESADPAERADPAEQAETVETTGRSAARRRRRGVSLATRLAAAAVGVSFAALAAATAVGIDAGISLGRGIYEDRLVSLGNAGADDVAVRLAASTSALEILAISPATGSALVQFDEAIDVLTPPDDFDTAAERRSLIDRYSTTYRTELIRGGDIALESLVATSTAAVYLQSQYSVVDGDDPPASVGDANDGSEWSAVHATYHASFSRFVDKIGLRDLYLVDADAERIIYSVQKNVDLGTSLDAGPFSGSVLANTVSRVLDSPADGPAVSDLSFYDATPGDIVGVIAAPVFDGGRLVGVVAGLYDGSVPTDAVSNGGDWESAGFDEDTERYVIGNDGTLRSDPRAFLDDPIAFLDAAEAAGSITGEERTRIERLGTTVLTMSAVDSTVGAATETATVQGTALDGDEIVASSTPVDSSMDSVPTNLDWVVLTEIDLAAAESALDDFRNILVVGTAVFLIVVAFVAVGWANRTMAPVRLVSDRLGDPDADGARVEIPASSPLEFHYLVASFRRMAAVLRRQHEDLAVARAERLRLMQQMLPPAVADRAAAGELDELDHVQQTTMAVVVVLGLADLVRSDDGRRVIEALHAELDGIAEQHGLERIKVVGDAYFASCGHDRPYLDHAPRAVTFAADARDAIDGFDTEHRLTAAIGVHTGPVTIGMVGREHMLFDVWGDTVSSAHLLARRAAGNEILISDRTHDYLPDEVAADSIADGDDTVWSIPLTSVGQRG